MKQLLLMLLLQIPLLGFSQESRISGKVVDQDNIPVAGVYVLIKGTQSGAVTDVNGDYSLNAKQGDVLTYSFLGMIPQEVTIQGQTTINITLLTETKMLDEVVVTALTIKRQERSLGYSQQRIEGNQVSEAKENNLVSLLSGKVAGIQITPPQTTTGSSRIVIRGANSLSGNNQPLFVVDGVPVDNSGTELATWSTGTQLDYGNNAGSINPDDIAEIQVLKGANAAALYGSRAANGVIMITTKQGSKQNGLKVNLNSSDSWSKIIEYPDYQNVYGSGADFNFTRDQYGMPNMADWYRSWGPKMQGQEVIRLDGTVGKYVPQPDNVKNFYQTARSLSNSISVEGGNEALLYRLSYTNLNSNSIVPKCNVDNRHTLNLRGSINKDRFKIDSKITYTLDKVDKRMYNNGNVRNPANVFIFMPRDLSLETMKHYKDADGSEITTEHEGFRNPYWAIYEDPNQDQRDRIEGFLAPEYKLTDWLTLAGRLGTDMIFFQGYNATTKGSSVDPDGYYSTFQNYNREINAQFMALAQKTFGDLDLSANFGGNISDRQAKNNRSTINSLIQSDLFTITNSNDRPVVSQYTGHKRINSLFGSFVAGYKNFAFLELTGRNDWSSALLNKNGMNSYFYPSANLSFVVSDIFKLPEFISFSKVRLSWAKAGNDMDAYRLRNYYQFSGSFNGQTLASPNIVSYNEGIKPEETTSKEIGLDASFVDRRINLDVTYYKSSTVNQIFEARMPASSGYDSKIFNAGEIQNKGIEITLNVIPVVKDDWRWEMTFNYAKNNSLVVSMIDGKDQFELNSWWKVQVVAEVGQPYGVMRGVGWARDEQGRKLVYGEESPMNLRGRPIPEENRLIGNATPDWTGSFSSTLRYKNLSVRTLLDAKIGGDMFSATYLKGTVWGTFANTLPGRNDYFINNFVYGQDPTLGEVRGGILLKDAYTPDGRKNSYYINPNNWYLADRDLIQELSFFDASYIKLREVVLSYTLPVAILKSTFIKNASVGVFGRNLAILYRNTPKGLDPEASTNAGNGQGIEFGSLPPMGTFGINVNLEF
ncbi:MAG TPA: SusC/RagA family TonB-linked outer membrane protein [Bacteroidales bacterium]|nr:SusC/RagA family TonB-linked outer membrane protein [Bacteroidales bacterium]